MKRLERKMLQRRKAVKLPALMIHQRLLLQIRRVTAVRNQLTLELDPLPQQADLPNLVDL
jgi:hypothetical protein